MKKIITITFAVIQLLLVHPLFSAVYEASTLHNSVSRSETVQDLYLKRWSVLQDKNFYFDIYGKINWIFNFDVNTINAGTEETEATSLRLTRTYGSMTFAVPLGGFRETPDGNDFLLALTTTGFHYGLTKTLTVDRGPAGSDSITDYKHSQFFDDIYAFTFMYRPYFTFHGGLIYNNECVPKDDGSMDYSDPVQSYRKTFLAVNVYKAMAFSMNIDNGKPESTKVDVAINPIVAFVTDVSNIYIPLATIGIERTAAYNDKPYDSVWVKTPKNTNTAYTENKATLNILSLKIVQRLSEMFTVEGYTAAQYINKTIYTKTDSKKINISKSKEWYLLINFDPVTAADAAKFKAYTGMSWYWDPAIAIHRKKPDKGNALYGWILGAECDFNNFGADFKTAYNFSTELKKLLEASDKWSVEGSIFFRI